MRCNILPTVICTSLNCRAEDTKIASYVLSPVCLLWFYIGANFMTEVAAKDIRIDDPSLLL